MLESLIEKARLFCNERRYAYRKTFQGPLSTVVLKDLAIFCRANESTFHENERIHVLAEGRREVWLRIRHHLDLREEELFALYSGEE
jgi:hypothetical protein